MKYILSSILCMTLLSACSPKSEAPAQAEPDALKITPLCRSEQVSPANLNVGPVAFMPKHLTVSVLERRARMDHLFIQFHGKSVSEFQDVTALYVGKEMPLMIGEMRLRFPHIPEMITNGEFVIDGNLYSGDIRELGERLAQPCEAPEQN
ncbi:MAG: hypothetical protein ACRBEQ_03075 [Hyphomonas sp.]